MDVNGDSLVVYLPDRGQNVADELHEMFGGRLWAMSPRMQETRDWMMRHSNYTKMMRFSLVDTGKRTFVVQRWCFRGSIDDWIQLLGCRGRLPDLVAQVRAAPGQGQLLRPDVRTNMAITNRERIGKALDLLNEGLRPFVERELKGVHGNKWEDVAREGQPPERGKGRPAKAGTPAFHFDTQGLLAVLWNQWNVVFAKTLGPAERSLVSELRDIRNKWAHQEAFASSDAYRALDSMERLLTAVSASEAEQIGQMRMDLLRLQFDEQRRSEMRKASFVADRGQAARRAEIVARSGHSA